MADLRLLAAAAALQDATSDCVTAVLARLEPGPTRAAPAALADLSKADLQRCAPLSLVKLADDTVRYVMATHVVQDRVVDREAGDQRLQLKLTELGAASGKFFDLDELSAIGGGTGTVRVEAAIWGALSTGTTEGATGRVHRLGGVESGAPARLTVGTEGDAGLLVITPVGGAAMPACDTDAAMEELGLEWEPVGRADFASAGPVVRDAVSLADARAEHRPARELLATAAADALVPLRVAHATSMGICKEEAVFEDVASFCASFLGRSVGTPPVSVQLASDCVAMCLAQHGGGLATLAAGAAAASGGGAVQRGLLARQGTTRLDSRGSLGLRQHGAAGGDGG